MDIAAELEAALAGDEPNYEVAPAEQGLVLNSDQATQWLAQLNSVRRKRTEVQEAFKAAIERMQVVVDERTANLNSQESWLEEALTIFHEIVLAEDPEGAKTIVLPTGTLKSGTWGGDIWDYDDEAFNAWAIDNLPGAVEYPEPKVKKAEAKKLVKEATLRVSDGKVILKDGTAVPGLTVSERPVAYKALTEAE